MTIDLVLAGSGSTAAGLLATIYELGRHSEWQTRLRSDINRLPESEYLSTAHLSKVDTLQAILKEALRLHAPFPGPFERVVAPGAEAAIANVKPLPVGTRIWSSLVVMGRSQQIFGAKVDEFRPERLRAMDDVYPVFGRGSRVCIGQDIAWMILQKTVVAVSNNHTF
jgi:cytochrome P450